MIIKVLLFLALVANYHGKVILSKDDDISNDIIETENITNSYKAENNSVHIDFTEINVIDISNDISPNDTAKPVIHIDLPVYNVTTSEEVKDVGQDSVTNESLQYTNNSESIIIENITKNNCSRGNDDDDDYNNIIIDTEQSKNCDINERVDNGTALILTPLIESGRLKEARNACKVNPEVFLGYESYSGFLTVNKTYNSNTFFWYFPVMNKKVNETPWIIWLQGGPGVSSLIGLFDEIGPFKFNTFGTLKENPYTWLKNHSLVFIDNPVGTGYSFTENRDGFVGDMATYGMHLYEAVRQFLEIFPELKKAPLFVAGESYAGKYVPALAIEIHRHKGTPGSDINMEGVMIGNAFVDPSEIANVSYPFLYFGLLNREQIEIVNPLLKSFQQDIADKNSVNAKNKWTNLIAILLFLSHQKQAYNFLKDELNYGHFVSYLKTTEMKRALHVGDIKYSFINITVNSVMATDFLSSSTSLFEELLDNDYRVLAYCGQLDQMLPCVFTSEHYRTWQWNGTSEFLEATRFPYIFNTKLAGYHKTGGGLTEVVIRGAGHMVPVDKPEPIQELVARWTLSQPLSRRFGWLAGSYVQEFVKNHSAIYAPQYQLYPLV